VYGYDPETKQQSSHIHKQPLSPHPRQVYGSMKSMLTVPVAMRSNAQVYSQSIAGIVDMNPPEVWMFISFVCCVFCR
jgi:FtsH-binding integral membrane protein